MTKKFKALALAFGIVLGVAGISLAVSGGDTFITQRDPTNSFNTTNILPYPTGSAAVTFDPVTNVPVYGLLGSGLSFDHATQTMTVAAVPESAITNLVSDLGSKASSASLATVATTGSYSDLTGKPSIPTSNPAYEGTNARVGAFPIFKSATVSSGTAVFNLTADGTSGGTSICPSVIADSVNAFVSDAAASYQMSYAFSNSNKTLTVTTNKLTTANILTGLLGQAAANGASVKVSVWCY